MVNAQEWLDKEYPLTERNNLTELDISDKDLTGELTLTGFGNLTKINCSSNNLTKLDLTPCSSLTELTLSYNNLTKLDLTPCSSLTELTCSYNNLTELDLTPCSSLTELWCSSNKLSFINLDNKKLVHLDCDNNQLTEINLRECDNLEYLGCSSNRLEIIKLPNNEGKLRDLFIEDNYLKEDLYIFKNFNNLKCLSIGKNSFKGSLKPLKNLGKLAYLSIINTNIDSGLEYLPTSIKNFLCRNDKNSTWKVKKINENLSSYALFFKNKYNLVKWKQDNEELINEILENDSILKIIPIINSSLVKQTCASEGLTKEEKILQVIYLYLEEKTKDIRKKLYRESDVKNQIEIVPKR